MRVSSKEQEKEGFSIPAQIKILREYAIKNDIVIEQEFADSETAKKAGREQFGRMLEFIKESDITTILVEKTDRLYRNFRDYVHLDELDLEIHLVKESEVLSKDSKSHQKFIHGIKVLMAKNYIDNLSEETKKGLYEKAESGYYPGPAPIGYINAKDSSGKRIVVPDSENAPMVKQVFEMYDSGNHSLDSLHKWVKENELKSCYSKKPIARSMVANMLKNPFYYGDFRYNGKIYQGKHEGLVSKDLWDRVQNRMTRGRTKPLTKHDFLFKGQLTCGDCGCAVVGEIQKGKYIYYHCARIKNNCNSKSVFVREEVLEDQFKEIIKSIQIPEDMIEKIVQALRESYHEKNKFRNEEIDRLNKQITKLYGRKDQAYLDKLDGVIDDDTWLKYNNQWQQEISRLQAKLASFGEAETPYYESGEKILKLARNAYKLYLKGTREEKRKILNLIHSNSKLIDGKVEPELKSPFHLMAEWANCPIKLRV